MKINSIILAFLLGIFSLNTKALSTESKQPLTYGIRMNVSRFSESSVAEGSFGFANPDLSTNYFLAPKHSLGVGLDAYFNLNALNLWSVRIYYNYYFKGQGHAMISENEHFKIEEMSKSSWYMGPEIRNYHYFLTTEQEAKLFINNENIDNTGSYFNFCIKLGYEYRLNQTYAFNLEASQGLASLASSDDRFNNKGSLLIFGFIITL